MIRTLLVPANQDISIQLPESFIGKEVEVIAFTIDETSRDSKTLTHLASQKILASDWLTTNEDEAWQDL